MNKYNKVMENIKVTEEMHERIIKNISGKKRVKNRWKLIMAYKRYAPVAAACLILLIAVFIIPWNDGKPDDTVMVVPDIVEHSTLEELADAVGFDIEPLDGVSGNITYTAFWGDLAEIRYENNEDLIVYRISKGSDDNSGDYNTYEQARELTIGDIEVTAKGDGDVFHLLTWTDGTMSYSISSESGLDIEMIEDIVR